MIIRFNLARNVASAILSYSVPAFADTPAHPPQIGFSANQLYPETLPVGPRRRMCSLSGSVRHGTVGKVTLDVKIAGPSSATINSYRPWDFSLTMRVNTLWVTNSDPLAREHRTNAGTQAAAGRRSRL